MVKLSGSSLCPGAGQFAIEARVLFPELEFGTSMDNKYNVSRLTFEGKMEKERTSDLMEYLQNLKKLKIKGFEFPEYFWVFAYQECFE